MRLLGAVLAALLLGVASGQAISYTVQVVAVSDQNQAFSLIRELGLEGFPAYAARATTQQGDVVRVRVGGFANRAAAVLYADAMPDYPALGGRPLPALAENIPFGVMPLEPRLLLDTGTPEATLLAWGQGIAVRLEDGGSPDTYWLMSDGNTVAFRAWAAWPDGDGLVLRLRDLPLWPASWYDDPEEVRQQQLELQLGFIAERLNLDAELLESAVREREDEPPVVVVYERFNPWLSLDVGQLLAIAVPAEAAPESAWAGDLHGNETGLPGEELLLHVDAETEDQFALEGDGWTITFDDPYMVQSVPTATRSWRAAVGTPLWTDGTYVLARFADTLLVYDFVRRE